MPRLEMEEVVEERRNGKAGVSCASSRCQRWISVVICHCQIMHGSQ